MDDRHAPEQMTTEVRGRRCYRIAGVTIEVESDLPITDATFDPKFQPFRVTGPGEDTVSIRHHFALPHLNGQDRGKEVYRRPPWAIYRKGDSWHYLGIAPNGGTESPYLVAILSRDHTSARIYHAHDEWFRQGNLSSLTLSPTDQILLARVLADRQGCYLHSAGAILGGKGLLFVGHSDAGKSTIVKMLQGRAEILCDDRNIVRRWPDGFKVHGTWSHGEVALVSPSSAPLSAMLFLHKSSENRVRPIQDRQVIVRRLLACVIRPLVTADWWEKTLALVEVMTHEIPCYDLEFDRSGKVTDLLMDLAR
jgi:hypothetical protein